MVPDNRTLDPRQLETFLHVAEERNFTRAAERLSLTQPAVTRQIMGLERELGTRLFERRGREAQLTAAGRQLREFARRILRLCDDARAAVSDVESGCAGDVTIGASRTLATYVLPGVLDEFRSCHPDVELSLSTGASSRIMDLVTEGAVDLGLVAGNTVSAPLVAVSLSEYQTVPIVPSGHPLTEASDVSVERFAVEPLILMKPGSPLRRTVDQWFAAAGVTARIALELDNVEVIKRMVETGLGLSLVPRVAVQEEVAAGRLAALSLAPAASPERHIMLVFRSDRYLTAAARALMELLRQQFQKRDTGRRG